MQWLAVFLTVLHIILVLSYKQYHTVEFLNGAIGWKRMSKGVVWRLLSEATAFGAPDEWIACVPRHQLKMQGMFYSHNWTETQNSICCLVFIPSLFLLGLRKPVSCSSWADWAEVCWAFIQLLQGRKGREKACFFHITPFVDKGKAELGHIECSLASRSTEDMLACISF